MKNSFRILFVGLVVAIALQQGCSSDDPGPMMPPPPPTPCACDTVVATMDNTLYEDPAGALSNGAGTVMFAGMTAGMAQPPLIRRALVFFDIGSVVSAGATIDSVFLVLQMSRTITGAQTVNLHKVSAPWGEGGSIALGEGGGGDSSQNGDATWIHAFFNTTFWASPGGDFKAAASASRSVAGNALYKWGSTAEMTADVQDWLDNPPTNAGWILIGNESTDTTAKRFDTREHPTKSRRPRLIIYSTP